MTVRVYKSTDTGAPQNTNAAGSLIAILDACLVNGYGTGGDAKAPAGWTKPFSGTNKAGYKQGAGSNGFYLRVDDSTTSAARVKGCEDMTGIDVTVSDFPTNAQVSGGLFLQKNNSATAKAWDIIASEKFFVFITSTDTATYRQLHIFGDIESSKSGDAFGTVMIAPSGSGTTGTETSNLSTAFNGLNNGHYLARPHTQIGSSLQCGKISFGGQSNLGGSVGIPYPSPLDGALHLAPIFIIETNAGVRGKLPCIWQILHANPFQQGDIITGTGEFAGKTFFASATGFNTANNHAVFEISDTW
jgi:hypothetical protein